MSQELWQIPIVQKMIPRVQSLQSRASRESILMEAYAIWCELQASKKLFPSHYGKLKNMYVPGDDERHNLGLKVARDLMDEAHPAAVSPTILQLLQTTEINRLFR